MTTTNTTTAERVQGYEGQIRIWIAPANEYGRRARVRVIVEQVRGANLLIIEENTGMQHEVRWTETAYVEHLCRPIF